MASSPRLEFQVAYCSLQGAEPSFDPDFNSSVMWDIPLLDGYKWTVVPDHHRASSCETANYNTGLWNLISKGQFDAVVCYVSYLRRAFWTCYTAARFSDAAFLFGTDATTLAARDGRSWKKVAKAIAWRGLFRLANQVIVPSTASYDLMRRLHIPEDRITLTPYAVDNEWWIDRASRVDRKSVRRSWGVSSECKVVLFCAKLQPWKRPFDVLRAFADCSVKDAILVFAGDGPLLGELRAAAASLKVSDRVRFLGFVNQSELPAIYRSADLMVLPSDYEPFAVVVNEAMCCGCPVIVSDRVGAARDLVSPVYAPFVLPCGNLDVLATTISEALRSRDLLSLLGAKCVEHMQHWSFRQNIPATIEAVERAVSRKARRQIEVDRH